MRLSEMQDMSNEVVLVTGASGHIGKIIVNTFLSVGATIVMVDINKLELKKFKDKNIKHKNKIHIFECDLENKKAPELIFNFVTSNFDRLDVIVNNAAFVGESKIDGWIEKFEDQSVETWRRAIEVNLTVIFAISQKFVKLLKSSGNGRIVNISSIYGFLGPNMNLYEDTSMGNPAAYAVSKGGLIQLSRWLSTTLAPNIRVNTISPGGIERGQPKEFQNKYISKTPLNKLGSEEDLIGVILFLGSNMSKYVTGQNIVVDGGFSAI
jgi:NAD(P)-dependent dehydrogenase (short-subunit alcohol dehydrogenase family)